MTTTTATEGVLELRRKYLGYTPGHLAKLRADDNMLLEFISWPWRESDGTVLIHARTIEEPTSMGVYECRKQISPVRWSMLRQQAYREGFMDGVHYAALEMRRWREGKEHSEETNQG